MQFREKTFRCICMKFRATTFWCKRTNFHETTFRGKSMRFGTFRAYIPIHQLLYNFVVVLIQHLNFLILKKLQVIANAPPPIPSVFACV